MTELNSVLLGTFAADEIMQMADRQMHGELHIAVSEQLVNIIDEEVEISDALRTLDKNVVINAAVEKFREMFSELLDECFEYHIEDEA
jgi:hypothetical protein